MSAPHDDELLRRCAAGDRSALDELIRRRREPVFRLAWRMTGDPALAEDAAASAFVKIWRKAGTWRGECSADTWIHRIVVRTVLDQRRGLRRWWKRFTGGSTESEPADPSPGPADSAELAESQSADRDRVQSALAELNEADRALVHLFYYEGKSLPEIEDVLGVSKETLKMRLARARTKLRTKLGLPDELE